jgi:NitT/TauT family transport system substrate-binding protein
MEGGAAGRRAGGGRFGRPGRGRELKLMSQYGIGYMQLTVMKADKLVEKHLAKNGLPQTTVTWARMGAGAAANDALLSGSLHLAAGGTGPAFILWDRTRGNVDVHGVAALSSMPNLLVTRNPNIRTIKDFTEKDRIAMAGAGSSVQTIYLQMAVAKEFGAENFKKLNPLMVNLPHPEGLRALLSGSGRSQSQFTSPPFQNQALEAGARVVLNSYDIMGGPNTFLMVWSTKKFRDENPKSYKAVLDALREATDMINADKRRAAEMYVAEGGGKEDVDKILKMMSDPQIKLHAGARARAAVCAVHEPDRHAEEQARPRGRTCSSPTSTTCRAAEAPDRAAVFWRKESRRWCRERHRCCRSRV